jgi:predicted MFS family arabinose efflux permease
MVHGSIGRSANPHRLFAMAGTALGVGAVVFYGAVPPAIAAGGGQIIFIVFAGLMALTAAACAMFPQTAVDPFATRQHAPLPRVAWFAVLGVTCMALNQSITFAMLDRIGVMRGFGQDHVNQVLLVCGFVNLLPAVLAALLQKRLSATRVAVLAPMLQAALAVVIASSPTFEPYALAASVYAAVLIFTHTFMFGLIARLDPSGRAVASTPAMMMTGSAIGPALGGMVAMRAGFGGLAVLAVLVGVAATCAFVYVSRHGRQAAGAPVIAAAE